MFPVHRPAKDLSAASGKSIDIIEIKFKNKNLIMPHRSFLDEIEQSAGVTVAECYQCYRCTNGCPVARDMDIVPHRVIGYIIKGEREKVLSSQALWTCLQCITCSVRCPNGIDVARVIETARRLSIESGLAAKRDTRLFDGLMINSVERHGRLYELETIMRYRLSKKEFFKDTALGLDMIRKGRIGLTPHNIRDRKTVRVIIREIKEGTGK